jgi:hypothetical protein
MRGGYVYYAQSKAHPSDPMYSKAYARKYDLIAAITARPDDFIVYRYSPDGRCVVIKR